MFAADGSTTGAAVFSGFNLSAGNTFAGLAATGLAGGRRWSVSALVYDSSMSLVDGGLDAQRLGDTASATIPNVTSADTAFHALAGGGFFQGVCSRYVDPYLHVRCFRPCDRVADGHRG
ncbi:MAG: hypothetical protein WDN06_15335 [Asticcacaulis sp.]